MSHEKRNRYLNTDLDLCSPQCLQPLVEFLAPRGIFALHVGQNHSDNWFGRFETDEEFSDPESNIASILTVIESLDGSLREQWPACTQRTFNIGFDCGQEP